MEEPLVVYLEIEEKDQNSGMDAISFVTKPATLLSWNKFSENEVKHFFEKNEMKRIVTGPVMLAETPIYRNSPIIGEYYVKFSEDTIFKMRNKYFMDDKINRVNEQHNPTKVVKGVYMVESYIVGDKVQSLLYPDLTKGSMMASFYIEDEDYWNNTIMKDEFNGFSLEGMFIENYEEAVFAKMHDQIKEILDDCLTEEEQYDMIQKIIFQKQ